MLNRALASDISTAKAFRDQVLLQILLDSSYEHVRQLIRAFSVKKLSLSLNQIKMNLKDIQRYPDACYHSPVLVYSKDSEAFP